MNTKAKSKTFMSGGRSRSRSMCGLLAAGLGAVLGGPRASQGQTFEVKITADNAYLLGYGTATSAIYFDPPVENCSAAEIYSCATGPETHFLTIPPGNDYLYIVAWSDDAVRQGVKASFKRLPSGSSTYTGHPSDNWEVFATDCPFDVCDGPPVGSPALNYTGPPNGGCTINEEILLANAYAGGTPSGGWEGLHAGGLWYGEGNLPGSPEEVCGLPKFTQWMWYSSTGSSPFSPGYDHQEYLIFRLPVSDLLRVHAAPAVSAWGIGALTFLLLMAVAIKFARRRTTA